MSINKYISKKDYSKKKEFTLKVDSFTRPIFKHTRVYKNNKKQDSEWCFVENKSRKTKHKNKIISDVYNIFNIKNKEYNNKISDEY